MKKLLIISLLISLTSCKKEEPIQCWGIVRTQITQNLYGYPMIDIQQDTSFQCGITKYELDKQCELNRKNISVDNQTSINIYYTFFPK